MALEKLDSALFATRVACGSVSLLTMVMYFGSGNVIFDINVLLSLVALGIQLLVSGMECFGIDGPLPSTLRSALLLILADSVAALLLIITGLGGVGEFILKTHDHVCYYGCKVSFVFSLLVSLGGALGGVATLLSLSVAAKMNLERHAQD